MLARIVTNNAQGSVKIRALYVSIDVTTSQKLVTRLRASKWTIRQRFSMFNRRPKSRKLFNNKVGVVWWMSRTRLWWSQVQNCFKMLVSGYHKLTAPVDSAWLSIRPANMLCMNRKLSCLIWWQLSVIPEFSKFLISQVIKKRRARRPWIRPSPYLMQRTRRQSK